MDDASLPSPDDELAPRADADADSLLRDVPAPAPEPDPKPPVTAVPGESYEIRIEPLPASPGVPPGFAASPAAKPSRTGAGRPTDRSPDEAVSEVWTRMGEWGRTWLVVATAALATVALIFASLSIEQYGVAFLTMMAGGVVTVLLAYPILITLERPVRVTPEQAVRDFFGALSHHIPHFRRMWLLLSDRGKYEGPFAAFEGFHNYWKNRLEQLKADRASPITPLKFVIDDFQAEKSAGKTELGATFTVHVLVRGKHAAGPVESFRVETTLVKGPDRMWYLDRGTLP